jgi:photosystem II stability/assembly factor-like uncharacterized protein
MLRILFLRAGGRVTLLASFFALIVLAAPLLALPRDVGKLLDALPFRHIGPIGNRVSAVAGVPGQPGTYYAGAASGGVFQTRDGGITWQPIFDDQPASSIGALAVAPSDPNVVWVGTGESFIRSNVSIGNGVYRSTDAGKTFEHVGLEASGRVGRIAVHPRDPDTAFVAALGHCYGPQEERGLYRTRDGGKTWQQVLFVDQETGAIDVVLRPDNPRFVYAATWQMRISTSERWSGGSGSGIFRSTDGGDTWERLGGGEGEAVAKGLPHAPWGKIGLTVTEARPDRVWALIETSSNRDFAPVHGPEGEGFQGVLWRSDDGGDNWTLISRDNTLTQRPLYYTRAVAAPDNENEITFLAVQQSLSIDGGSTITAQNSGWDHHDMWIDPLDPDRRITGHDGGVSITTNRGSTWLKPQLPIAQLYHVNVDDRIPYWVYGNRQDGPSMMGPSNTLTAGDIPIDAWSSVGGCEVGFAVPTPGRSEIVWTGCYDGILERFDRATGQARDVSVWPIAVESWASEDLELRFQWSFPVAISPHDPDTVYVGSQHVHRTTDGGQSWQEISPDLTSNDPALQRRTGGLTLDDAGPTIAPVVFAIAESPRERGLIWAGTNDGVLQVSRDGGIKWSDTTAALRAALPGMPALATVSSVEPSRHRAGRAYVALDGHQENHTGTWIARTDDFGRTFTSLRADIPQSVFSYAHVLREDPEVEGLLYLGTHNTLFVSFDDGNRWHELRSSLPRAPIHWLAVQEHFGDLVLATYGRGFWILDDISPLRAIARGELDRPRDPLLLAPRDAYRFRMRPDRVTQPDVPATGENPQYGAALHVYVPDGWRSSPTDDDAPDTEDGSSGLRLRVYDSADEMVRELTDVATEPGLHRMFWNLRGETTPEVELLLPPLENPRLPMPESGKRPLRDGGRVAVLEPPGVYRVELLHGDNVLAIHELRVLPDPEATPSQKDLDEQLDLVRELREAVDLAARTIHQIEDLRLQLANLRGHAIRGTEAADKERAVAAKDRIEPLERELESIENELFDLRLTSAGQDTLRWKRKLYSRLTDLFRRVHQTDHRPTDQHRAVAAALLEQLETVRSRYRAVIDEQLPALDSWLRDQGVGHLLVAPSL